MHKTSGDNLDELVGKADVLVEALPYMRAFSGKNIVIKYGGSAMVNDDLKENFARDITLLKHIGIHPVIVHGGGPQIGKTLERMKIKTRFVDGMRVTDKETVDVVEMVLVGLVNKEIVANINHHGAMAIGLSGKDGALVRAEKMVITRPGPAEERPEIIDIGMVGKVVSVRAETIKSLESAGFIPVIAPVGFGDDGETYNINADFVASAITSAIGADKLGLLTDTPGILDRDGKLISSLTKSEADDLIGQGVINGGMIPKVRACLDALDKKVSKTHIIDGRIKHSALLEIFTKEGIGTQIRRG